MNAPTDGVSPDIQKDSSDEDLLVGLAALMTSLNPPVDEGDSKPEN